MAQHRRRNRRAVRASACAAALLMASAGTAAPALAGELGGGQEEPAPPMALPEVPTQVHGGRCTSPSEDIVDQQVWTENALGLPQARKISEGEGVTVAILAEAVDDTSPALSGAVQGDTGEDCNGLGTFLAGVVAARPQPDSGLVGVAPAAEVLAVGMSDDAGYADTDAMARSIVEAAEAGAGVILIALTQQDDSAALQAALDTAADADALVVAPSTDEGAAGMYSVPADRDDVLGVVSTDTKGGLRAEADWSALGDEAASPDIAAPGQAILGAAPDSPGHTVAQGDIAAAGFVAGTAALVRSEFPEFSAAETADRLKETAYPSSDEQRLGSGSVDPVGALSRTAEAHAESGIAPQAPALAIPMEPTRGRVMALVGATALLAVIAAVGAAAARRRRLKNTG